MPRHKSIKKVRKDRLKKFVDRRLIQALSHPVREHLLAVFTERIASTTEIGDEIDLDVSAFYKHVKLLESLGYIEWVESRPVRGASEHFFQAKRTLLLDDRTWAGMPENLKSDITVDFLQSLFDEAATALKKGTFNRRLDSHASWTPGILDLRGWREAMALLGRTLERFMEIQRESAQRVVRTGETGIPATVGLMGFETPPGPTLVPDI